MSKRNVRRLLLEEQGGRCAYCFNKMTMRIGCKNTVTRDHVKPKSRGGLTNVHNIVGACSTCNEQKGDLPLLVFLLNRSKPCNS